MLQSFHAEFTKLWRRKVVLVTAVVVVVAAVGGSALVLGAVEPAAQANGSRSGLPRAEELSSAGGGTEIFRTLVGFAGTFLFVVFVGTMAVEFSRGTMRTMLLRQPRRLRLLVGKLAALLAFAAAALVVCAAGTWVAAHWWAAGAGVRTSQWTSLRGLGAAGSDMVAVLLWVTAYAVLGATVAMLLRSVPVALAVGVAWAGPLEHILQDSWSPASRYFPGLLLEAFAAGGTVDVSAGRALGTVALYVVAAALVTSVVFSRRDVTA